MKDVERWLGTDKWKSDKKFILIRLPYVRWMMDDGRWKKDDGRWMMEEERVLRSLSETS